ncbi:MAG: DNA methyltransferase [Spirochaetaceae bacterium]|nr:DNA methyltransferase [Spirochaetaceae bacterium]
MRLSWHDYSYYPYERELAAREVATMFNRPALREIPGGLELTGVKGNGPVGRLTYFSAAVNGRVVAETLQSRLERAVRVGRTRQATRYSVHGLHEYKGKFNPQVAKALLNIFGVRSGGRVLDPFCGSGTTLVECAHADVLGVGIDINPFAVFLANAKLHALVTPVAELRTAQRRIFRHLESSSRCIASVRGPRISYLRSWFTPEVLGVIETIRIIIEDVADPAASVFLAVASDQLRDYSLQDPKDLRIRRRRTPLPDVPFAEAFSAACDRFFGRLEAVQTILGTELPQGYAELRDAASLSQSAVLFDAAITSPPYAMALPYIDTQRLSLIWLGILEPPDVSRLESELIGSREFRGDARRTMAAALKMNAECLPNAEAAFCLRLRDSLTSSDGFRRQAVPALLYRYLASMRDCFRAVRDAMRPRAPFALIVGHNHTVLGGVRYDIETPTHLAALAEDTGWTVEELLPLQTYRRYGYHVSNAVRNETLVILRNS